MTSIEDINDLCERLPYCTVDSPFGPDTLTYRVGGHIFALLWLNVPGHVSIKVDPDLVEELIFRYEEIEPAFHLNKKHWVQLTIPCYQTEEWVMRLLRHSYAMVWRKLSRTMRSALADGEPVYRQALAEISIL